VPAHAPCSGCNRRAEAGHVVEWHPHSQRLNVRSGQPRHIAAPVEPGALCPLCRRPLSQRPTPFTAPPQRSTNYFRILSESLASSPASSRPSTPGDPARTHDETRGYTNRGLPEDVLVTGYFARFFVEESKLGRGQRSMVYRCRHVLDGNLLAHYAVKKITVGDSSEALLAILREVRLLESLRHHNIVAYHHSWIEHSRLTTFGPVIPVLFVLMEYANGGRCVYTPRKNSRALEAAHVSDDGSHSLDNYIRSRHGLVSRQEDGDEDDPEFSRESRIRLFRARRNSRDGSRPTESKAVHLLRLDEILSIFADTCRGLAFLHDHDVLHLDLKAENVLLQWDDLDSLT
jgi:Protein tyrosine and serine/threonine kinase